MGGFEALDGVFVYINPENDETDEPSVIAFFVLAHVQIERILNALTWQSSSLSIFMHVFEHVPSMAMRQE